MRRAYVEICWADYYARAYDVPLEFAQAVIDVESGWHPYVISSEL
jgi:soluble lytic murein transglycosylase-like protein